ncbi:hypothetical protein [Desulfofalx alkaliphila]|uniref:hypothetical protein n=1 Tax=Desulfofalx alkaliphila TaxID=105483 RepID=UPI0004E286AF|nr:hypothetical protein [Desulfofalx alkaliphila]
MYLILLLTILLTIYISYSLYKSMVIKRHRESKDYLYMWQPSQGEWIEALKDNKHVMPKWLSVLLFFIIMLVAFGLSSLREEADLVSVLYYLALGFFAWFLVGKSMAFKAPYTYIVKENGLWVLGEPHWLESGFVRWKSVSEL